MSQGTAYIWRPAGSGALISVPDDDALDLVGDLDIAVCARLPDYTPASEVALLGKFAATGNQRSYALSVTTGGLLQLQWSGDGSAAGLITAVSTSALSVAGVADGERVWMRATLDVDDEASGYVARFFSGLGNDAEPNYDETAVNLLGSDVTDTPETSVFAGSANLQVGSIDSALGTTDLALMRAMVWSGVLDTLALDLNFANAAAYNAAKTQITDGANGLVATLAGEYVFVPAWDDAVFPVMATAALCAHAGDGNGNYGPSGLNPWADLSGNDHHLQKGATSGDGSDDPTFATDHFNIAAGDFFQAADHDDLDFAAGESFTIVAQVKVPTLAKGVVQILLSKKGGIAFGSPGYVIYIDGSGDLIARISDGTAQTSITASLPENSLATIAFVRDVGADNIEVYVNGTPTGAPVTDSTTGSLATSEPLIVGTQYAEDQNFIIWSEALDDSAWAKSRVTISANNTAGPAIIGGTGADLVTETAETGVHRCSQTGVTSVAGKQTLVSFFAKANTRTWIRMECYGFFNGGGHDTYFDLQNGVLGQDNGGGGVIEDAGNGWYRCSKLVVPTVTGDVTLYVDIASGDGVASYAGDTGESLWATGLQVRHAVEVMPYTPTTSAPVGE